MAEQIPSELPQIRTTLPGPRARSVIERDARFLSPSYTREYPLVAERASGAIVEDVDGNRFLDFNAGIAVVATGHCHPRVVAAIQAQAARLIHMSGTDFYYQSMADLAEKLAALPPGDGPWRVYFGNSGAEAMEAALKLARYYTGRHQFIAFYGAFHGRTMGALSLTASKSIQKTRFAPFVPGVHHIPYPDCYRCPYGQQPDTCSVECAAAIEERIIRHIAPAEEIAAVVVEPVQGEGGYIVPPPKFFEQLQDITRRYGILLIADEVQSGMGRTGRMFAVEHFNCIPDIIAVAKGIASGMPLSATLARADIMSWPPGAHASTFGGNPVSIAAALATLDLLQQELIGNAARVGAHIMNRIQDWPQRFRHVGHVRGLGLMIGVEIVRRQSTKERAPELRNRLVRSAFERGLLILSAGINAIRLCPPLIITTAQADFAVDTLEECLRELEAAPTP
jgi:4-aminobutyrate aminotransferase